MTASPFLGVASAALIARALGYASGRLRRQYAWLSSARRAALGRRAG